MWHTMSAADTIKALNTSAQIGLKTKEVEKRKKKYGLNVIEKGKKIPLFIKFINQFKDFMIIILLIAAGVSAVMSYFEGTNEYIDSFIIVGIVILNALMGLFQESKAEKSIDALKKMAAPHAKVRRDGKIMSIKGENIVPGDILLLEAGNLIPADARLIESFSLKVEEAALTGETVPVLKNANMLFNNKVALGDTLNMIYASTIITNGTGKAVVTDTSMNTKVGKIAKLIISHESPETPLQKKLSDVGKKLGIAALIICFAIFVIGTVKDIPISKMFMTSIGLAVAAIPEGLPAIVTIMLSIGITKMAKKNAIIRKLPAVETLGSSSVICSDKTGTLTQNKMEVVKLMDFSKNLPIDSKDSTTASLLKFGSLCNDSDISANGKNIKIDGDPTEVAIVNAAIRSGYTKYTLFSELERINEIPFDSNRKLMTTIHKDKKTYIIITKGAPDALLKKCSTYLNNGKVCSMNNSTLYNIEKNNEDMASSALRVIAVAYSEANTNPDVSNVNKIENNLTFVGLIGMIDPPREGVFEAVKTCTRAGIKTVMITGDHLLTAKSIASNLGILKNGDLAITGSMLDTISDAKLKKDIMKYSVFARVSPEHKVRIVTAFQSTSAVVAMTGDGVNDAPALKKADIGISMGLNGTDVAKNASDMILTDDNFVTIVEAVKEGRHIYDNIRKAVHFLIATNVGEIVAIFVGLLLGMEPPLLAIQLLWINLVTDSFPAIGLGLEPAQKDIMYKKPKDPKKGIFSDGLFAKIFFEGTIIGILTLVAFKVGTNLYSVEIGRTMAFLTLGFLELLHSFNIKSNDSIFSFSSFKNIYLNIAFLLGATLQIGVVAIPKVAEIFDVCPLNTTQWIYVICISSIILVIMEIKKKITPKRSSRIVFATYKQRA